METTFERAAAHLPNLIAKHQLDDDQLLFLYARYKQATEGKCNTTKPGFFEFQAKKKWDAWHSLADMPKEEAQKQYVEKIKELDVTWVADCGSDTSNSPAGTGNNAGACPPANRKQGWVTVSAPVDQSEKIADKDKTAFDWCQEGNLAELKKIVSAGSPILQMKDGPGLTLLHWACDRGHADTAEFLLKCGADPNCEDGDGQTPLHYACSCGHADIVKLLLTKKADPRATDGNGETPIQMVQDAEVKKVLSTWNFWRGSGESL